MACERFGLLDRRDLAQQRLGNFKALRRRFVTRRKAARARKACARLRLDRGGKRGEPRTCVFAE
jgi:hypothetical protein